jgi:hypothetical protein
MSARGLLVAHAVGGGIPPASSETLRLYESGIARAVVGNAWPFGAPQHEAGSYEHELAPADLAMLEEAIVVADGFETASTPTADAGRWELRLGDGRRAVWPATAAPPAGLAALVERLRGLSAETRRHPVGAVALSLEPPAGAAAGEPLELGLTLHNPGTEAVGLEPGGALRLRAIAAVEGEVGGRPDLEALVAAEPLAVAAASLPGALAAGERRTVAARTGIATPGRWRLDVLALLTAALPYEGDSLRLGCVLLAGPVVVTVSG